MILCPYYQFKSLIYNVICRKMQRVRFCLTRSVRKLKLLRKITLVCGTSTKRMGRYFTLKCSYTFQIQWNPDFANLQGKWKLVWKIWEFKKLGVKSQGSIKEGKPLLIWLIRKLKNWLFKKLGFYYKYMYN